MRERGQTAEIKTEKRVQAGRGSGEQEHNSRTLKAQGNLCLKWDYEDSPLVESQDSKQMGNLLEWTLGTQTSQQIRIHACTKDNVREYL